MYVCQKQRIYVPNCIYLHAVGTDCWESRGNWKENRICIETSSWWSVVSRIPGSLRWHFFSFFFTGKFEHGLSECKWQIGKGLMNVQSSDSWAVKESSSPSSRVPCCRRMWEMINSMRGKKERWRTIIHDSKFRNGQTSFRKFRKLSITIPPADAQLGLFLSRYMHCVYM